MIPKKKRQRHKDGDVFVVPLTDGAYSLGQVLGYERQALNAVACAFYSIRIFDGPSLEIPAPLPQDRVISILLTTPDSLNRAIWPLVANRTIATPTAVRPYEQYRASNWVGARIIGSGIVSKFLNAYFALAAWDAMYEADYYDRLLLNASLKPNILIYTHAA